MKHLVSIFLSNIIFIHFLYAQSPELNLISATEKSQFSKNQKQSSSALPNNYDLKYCRADWSVDPAIKYISGNVFYLFYHNDSLNEFKLELSDSLVADSVFMQGVLLNHIHNSNILTIDLNQYLPE